MILDWFYESYSHNGIYHTSIIRYGVCGYDLQDVNSKIKIGGRDHNLIGTAPKTYTT
jgi:hypothetical protein